MNGSWKVARADEVGPGQMKGVQVDGEEALLVNLGGTLCALGGECTHAGALLADGLLEGEVLECPLHGGRFNVRTGEVVERPPRMPLPVYEVRVEGGDVLVGPRKAQGPAR